MIAETWKDIEDYDGRYKVSDAGRVMSFAKNKCGKIMALSEDSDGYLVVNLTNQRSKRKKTCKVHRLVAKAFIDNPHNYPEINHKDENKKNNSKANLEWCTTQYNLTYGHRLDCVRGERGNAHKLTEKQVKEIRKVYKKGDLDYGQSALGKKYGVAHGSIAAIVKGKSWKHILMNDEEGGG